MELEGNKIVNKKENLCFCAADNSLWQDSIRENKKNVCPPLDPRLDGHRIH